MFQTENGILLDNELHNQKLYIYKDLLTQLPAVNYATLKVIIGHLKQ